MGSHGVPGMYVLFGALGVPIALGVAQRWRRLASSPELLPGEAAQLYATRSEAQIGADWMCIPAARNLHWRYQILRQAFLVCKTKVAPGLSPGPSSSHKSHKRHTRRQPQRFLGVTKVAPSHNASACS